MRATGTFRVESLNAVALDSPIETALPVGVATISGAGGMAVDADGTHRVWFDYEL